MSAPRVSFVVAAYNHQEFVGQSLRSVLAQTFADLELIVIDDGSTDDTPKIAHDVAASDPRVRLYAQQNRGVVEARNRGVLLSRGEYISVVDSDDLLPLERTQWQVEALDAHRDAPLVYGDAWLIDRNGERTRRFFSIYPPRRGVFSVELFATYCFVPAVSVMFRRSAFDRTGPFWGPGPSTDYLKWIELGLLGPVVCLADKQLGCWRLHGKNVSKAAAVERARHYHDLRVALQRLVQHYPELGRQIGQKRLRWRLGRCHFMAAFYAALEHAWGLARTHFRTAYGFNPSLVNAVGWVSTLPGINAIAGPLYQLGRRVRQL